MKKVVLSALIALALLLVSYSFSTPAAVSSSQPLKALKFKAPPAETFNFNEIYDFTGYYYNPCNGELIEATGSIHATYHGVINKNKAQFKDHFNTQGVSGVGLETGTKYQIVSVTNTMANYNVQGCVVTYSSIQTFKIVSAGSDDNFTVKANFSYTYNYCTGEFELTRDKFTAECK